MRRVALALLVWMGAARVSAEPVTTIRNNGEPAKRVDLVILGDGYTALDLATGEYEQDVESLVQAILAQQPYAEYRTFFNVHRVDVTSAESGADHPPTVFRNTALDAAYNCGGIARLICVNTSKVYAILSNSGVDPAARDTILVLVNDPEYGGSGGSILVASTHLQVAELVLHEMGHSFALLADEYGGPPPPACNNSIEPSAPNATKATTREQIKWNVWIEPTTPVPTFWTLNGVPGLYEGAVYCDAGLYRPTHNSKMRSLGSPFEQINTEQHVRRIYNYASPIDSTTPTPGSLTLASNASQTFTVVVPQPVTHSLNAIWKLDGAPVATGGSYVLNGGSVALGTHALELTVTDSTPFVRNDPAGALRAVQTWQVQIFCALQLASSGAIFPSPGGPGVVEVTAAPTCAWTAASNTAFVTVTGGNAGTGNGTVYYDVLSNAITNTVTAARAGTITIGVQTFTVSQAGCSFGLATTATTFDATGGSGAVDVATGAGCTWTVTGVPAWATTTDGGSGTGAGTWRYDVAANATLSSRASVVAVAGQPFALTQLAVVVKPLVAGARMAAALTDATSERWASSETVAGRSYCASLTPARHETVRASPALAGFRSDGSTALTVGPILDPALPQLCFIAPATETTLFRATQTDGSPRNYLLAVTETTLWANWFFIGGDYSSYTLLRNTSGSPVTASVTWRDTSGAVAGQETVAVPPGGVVYRDARVAVAPGTVAGSVEVAHNGGPSAIAGSQTTLSVTTGLSFDTLLAARREW